MGPRRHHLLPAHSGGARAPREGLPGARGIPRPVRRAPRGAALPGDADGRDRPRKGSSRAGGARGSATSSRSTSSWTGTGTPAWSTSGSRASWVPIPRSRRLRTRRKRETGGGPRGRAGSPRALAGGRPGARRVRGAPATIREGRLRPGGSGGGREAIGTLPSGDQSRRPARGLPLGSRFPMPYAVAGHRGA
jgi:hypothetical protein